VPSKSGEENTKNAKSVLSKLIRFVRWAMYMVLLYFLCYIGLFIWQVPPHDMHWSCSFHLQHMGMVYKMYAHESEGNHLPPLSNRETLFCALEEIHPMYIKDTRNLLCPHMKRKREDAPSPAEDFSNRGHVYFGYALSTEDEMVAFLEHYPEFMKEGVDFTQDLPAPPGRGSFGGDTFVRLREGLSDTFPNMEPKSLPIMMDDGKARFKKTGLFSWKPLFHHNVLFMDGHVEHREFPFQNYPEKFPATELIAAALRSVLE
jgi:prepilin-type processing-associated H-X9-DG protein